MALLVNSTKPLANGEYFIFDLEVVSGTEGQPKIIEAKDNHIWDIAVQHLATHTTFSAKVDPQLPTYAKPPAAGLRHVTHEFLHSSGARPFSQIAHDLLCFLQQFGNVGAPVALISHGAFLLDKRMLEVEFARCNMIIPSNIYFFDTLPYFRRVFRRQPSYSLKSLYRAIMPTKSFENHHSALDDVLALRDLVHVACGGNLHQLVGCMCPPYLTPLQTVKFIGHQKEMMMFKSGISCVEELILLCAKRCYMNENTLCKYLQNQCHIERASALKVARQILITVIKQCGTTACG